MLFPFVAAAKRLRGYRVFHLHWHAFYLDKKYGIPGRTLISLVNTVVSLTALKVLGYRLVWTVHNVLPHEPQTSNDRFVTRFTARLASRLIVHSTETVAQLKTLGVDTAKAVVIPHGNYEGMYPVTLDRNEARKRLGLAPQERAVLFFGNIRPYKGIEKLLDAFAQLNQADAQLIIAGKCLDPQLDKTIRDFAAAHPKQVTYTGKNVPDDAVATYFLAADVACMPFTTITTSGSVVLAATFGVPIVAPRIGAIKDIPKEVGVLYNPAQKAALAAALKMVLADDERRARMVKASAAYAKTLDWDTIAARTYAVYTALFTK